MGQLHEAMPVFQRLPVIGIGMLKMIAVALFHQKVGFNGPPMATRPVTPGDDIGRAQALPRDPDPLRLMGFALRVRPGFVAERDMHRGCPRPASRGRRPGLGDIVHPGEGLSAIAPVMRAPPLPGDIEAPEGGCPRLRRFS